MDGAIPNQLTITKEVVRGHNTDNGLGGTLGLPALQMALGGFAIDCKMMWKVIAINPWT